MTDFEDRLDRVVKADKEAKVGKKPSHVPPKDAKEVGLSLGYPAKPSGERTRVAHNKDHDTKKPKEEEYYDYPSGSDRPMDTVGWDETIGTRPKGYYNKALEEKFERVRELLKACEHGYIAKKGPRGRYVFVNPKTGEACPHCLAAEKPRDLASGRDMEADKSKRHEGMVPGAAAPGYKHDNPEMLKAEQTLDRVHSLLKGSEWVPFTGPHGGRGAMNTMTGETIYGARAQSLLHGENGQLTAQGGDPQDAIVQGGPEASNPHLGEPDAPPEEGDGIGPSNNEEMDMAPPPGGMPGGVAGEPMSGPDATPDAEETNAMDMADAEQARQAFETAHTPGGEGGPGPEGAPPMGGDSLNFCPTCGHRSDGSTGVCQYCGTQLGSTGEMAMAKMFGKNLSPDMLSALQQLDNALDAILAASGQPGEHGPEHEGMHSAHEDLPTEGAEDSVDLDAPVDLAHGDDEEHDHTGMVPVEAGDEDSGCGCPDGGCDCDASDDDVDKADVPSEEPTVMEHEDLEKSDDMMPSEEPTAMQEENLGVQKSDEKEAQVEEVIEGDLMQKKPSHLKMLHEKKEEEKSGRKAKSVEKYNKLTDRQIADNDTTAERLRKLLKTTTLDATARAVIFKALEGDVVEEAQLPDEQLATHSAKFDAVVKKYTDTGMDVGKAHRIAYASVKKEYNPNCTHCFKVWRHYEEPNIYFDVVRKAVQTNGRFLDTGRLTPFDHMTFKKEYQHLRKHIKDVLDNN